MRCRPLASSPLFPTATAPTLLLRQRCRRHYATAGAEEQEAAPEPTDVLLYRGRWILPMRWCLRLKLFQAAGALSVANLLFVDPGSSTDIILATGLVGGIGGVTYSLWWFSRAYVGELRLLSQAEGPADPALVLSVLDFWGNRNDRLLTLSQLGTPLARDNPKAREEALEEARKKPFVPVDIAPPLAKHDAGTVFVSLSQRHAERMDAGAQTKFERLLQGLDP